MGCRLKGVHGVRAEYAHLICSFRYGNGTANIGGSSTIHYTVIDDKVPNRTNSIVQCTFCLVHDLVSRSPRVGSE